MDQFVSEVLEQLPLGQMDRKLLKLLAGYSCKFPGVSFMKLKTMAAHLQVSIKTIQRAIKNLANEGIVKRMKMIRPVSGGYGASLTLICPIDLSNRSNPAEPVGTKDEPPCKKNETILFQSNLKDLKERQQEPQIDYSYVTEWVPHEFLETVQPFINPESAFRLWGKVLAAGKRHAPSVVDLVPPAIRAFKASVFALKMKRIKKSFAGYFWGTVCGVLGVEQRRAKGPLYNWLE
ncbi:transcriptional regulator [Bacillus sp. FJAT-42376]|nr:transcriptional regulator [Bacillus sp. FJAT-42376]